LFSEAYAIWDLTCGFAGVFCEIIFAEVRKTVEEVGAGAWPASFFGVLRLRYTR
jgi:hypothetical protein